MPSPALPVEAAGAGGTDARRRRRQRQPRLTAHGLGSLSPAALELLLVDAATRDVSSTEVRRRLESGESIADLVPAVVETYIGQHRLYSRGDAGATVRQITCMTRITRDQTHGRAGGRKRLPAEVDARGRAALDKKATNVVVLDLRHTPAFTDFFVLCSGQNSRQVKAIADSVEDTLRASRRAAGARRGLRSR